MNATAIGGANQSSGTSIFRYENTGNVNMNITLVFDSAPACAGGTITVKAAWADAGYSGTCSGDVSNSDNCTTITTTATHIANLTSSGEQRDLWLWADFSTCNPNLDTSQTLDHTSSENP